MKGEASDGMGHRRMTRQSRIAEGRWENEGGASRTSQPPVPDAPPGTNPNVALTSADEAADLDVRQDQIMARESSDGRPPTHRERRRDWRWLAAAAILVVAGFITWIVVDRAGLGLVATVLLYAVLLMVAASPVWIAGLLRGGEERAARRKAEADREAGDMNG